MTGRASTEADSLQPVDGSPGQRQNASRPIHPNTMSAQPTPQLRMREYLQLVATGPELSKSLNRSQAKDAMEIVLRGEADPIRCGIFLIALRMKRETDEENIGVMDALISVMSPVEARSPAVLALADPFNGFLRSIPATPFVPAVLAACGLPTYLHGIETTGPKYGLTPRMILAAAGHDVDLDVPLARDRLDDPGIGWAYLDQRRYAPQLHDLMALRDAMVKRCCLSTIEVVLRPIGGAETSHLMTGYVHKAYPPVYAALAAHAGFRTAAIVRGVEGGCVPSLSQLSRFFAFTGQGEPRLTRLSPEELGIRRTERAIAVPERFADLLAASTYGHTAILEPVAEYALQLGLEALSGTPGPMYDSLVYAGAVALSHTGIAVDQAEGAALAREAISTGEALRRFEAAAFP